MEPNHIWLYIAEDTPESRGLFEKIKAILGRCHRPLAALLHNPFLWGYSLSFTISGFAINLKRQSEFLIFLFGALLLICVFLGFYGVKDSKQRYTIIIPKYKIESPNFVKRNRDKILLAVISAIIGALITHAITYILKFK